VEPKVGIEPTAYALPTRLRVRWPCPNTRLESLNADGQLTLLGREPKNRVGDGRRTAALWTRGSGYFGDNSRGTGLSTSETGVRDPCLGQARSASDTQAGANPYRMRPRTQAFVCFERLLKQRRTLVLGHHRGECLSGASGFEHHREVLESV